MPLKLRAPMPRRQMFTGGFHNDGTFRRTSNPQAPTMQREKHVAHPGPGSLRCNPFAILLNSSLSTRFVLRFSASYRSNEGHCKRKRKRIIEKRERELAVAQRFYCLLFPVGNCEACFIIVIVLFMCPLTLRGRRSSV